MRNITYKLGTITGILDDKIVDKSDIGDGRGGFPLDGKKLDVITISSTDLTNRYQAEHLIELLQIYKHCLPPHHK